VDILIAIARHVLAQPLELPALAHLAMDAYARIRRAQEQRRRGAVPQVRIDAQIAFDRYARARHPQPQRRGRFHVQIAQCMIAAGHAGTRPRQRGLSGLQGDAIREPVGCHAIRHRQPGAHG